MTDQIDYIKHELNSLPSRESDGGTHGAVTFRPSEYESSIIKPLLLHEVVVHDYRHQQSLHFPIDPAIEWTIESLARRLPLDAIVQRSTVESGRWITLQLQGDYWIGSLNIDDTNANLQVFATTPTRAAMTVEAIRSALKYEVVRQNFVSFKVWTADDDNTRRMREQRWASIDENYPKATRDKLSELMRLKQDARRGGKIIIWHGEPGTGKTNALRALMTEWSWARPEIVSDPEMLTTRTDYLNRLIDRGTRDQRTRLIIIEDSDSLLVESGRAGSRSPGMARLLNVADGLLGIHQDLIFLFTTNAPPNQLDAALSRPGRCLAHIKFNRFEPSEITQLFGEDIPNPKTSMTLAEIWGARYEQVNIFDESHPAQRGQYL